MRRVGAVALVLMMVVGVLATIGVESAGAAPPTVAWSHRFGGQFVNRTSSPVVADVNGDGVAEIVMGHQDGYLRVVDAATGMNLPGWPRPADLWGGIASAIDSSPAVADLDGDGRPEIIVGVGSNERVNQPGGIMVFRADGSVRCRVPGRDIGNLWNGAPVPDGYPEAVFSSPAIGDVDGDRLPDIVYGGFDLFIHALDRNCNELPGYPYMVEDSTWGSPALYDVDGDGAQEIFIGSDQSAGGAIDWSGGEFRAIDYVGGPREMWKNRINDVITSSPAIGDVDGDGRLEVVVGGGYFFGRGDGTKVWAWHLDNGSALPGWPVPTGGATLSSPALGDLNGDGRPEVVIGSRDGFTYAIRGNGTVLWQQKPTNCCVPAGPVESSPIVADVDGDGDQDVVIGNNWGAYALDGQTGGVLFGGTLQNGYSYVAAAAIGDFGSQGRLLVTIGFTPDRYNFFAAYRISGSAAPAWPMFRKNARRLGTDPSDPPPPEWRAETLVGRSGQNITSNDVGRFTAAVTFAGAPHVFSYDASAHNLRHEWWTGSRWMFEVLDGPRGRPGSSANDIGQHVTAMLYAGAPHLFSYDATARALRHQWWTGSTWMFETLDGPGGRPGSSANDVGQHVTTMSYLGSPHLFSYDATARALRHQWWTGTRWMFETLDGPGGRPGSSAHDIGQSTVAVLYGGNPHLFTYDATTRALRHAWWTGATWLYEVLDGSGGRPGSSADDIGSSVTALLYAGSPHVFAYDGSAHTLRHAWWTGSTWLYEVLDGPGGRAGSSTNDNGQTVESFLYDGVPHLVYRDATGGDLRHAWWTGLAWGYETLDGAGGTNGRITADVGVNPTVVIVNRALHVFSYESTGQLRHAWYA